MPHSFNHHANHGHPPGPGGDTAHAEEPGSELPVEPDLGTPLVPDDDGNVKAPA